MITCLVPREELDGETIHIVGEPYRHLFRARRLACGSRIRWIDGEGRARWGEVVVVGPRSAEILLGEPAPVHGPPRAVKLLVAMHRLQRASWLVEKATELGVEAICFLDTERTTHQLSEGKLERLQRVAAAALEQCHGAQLPRLTGPHEVAAFPSLLEGWEACSFLDPPQDGEPSSFPERVEKTALLVGPEGGWSAAERAAFLEAGCQAWSLGDRVFRVETAAILALGLVLHSA